MARKSLARPRKIPRPLARNSPSATPRAKAGRKVQAEATSNAAELSVRGTPYPIVGIGASAGGFEAFRDLLKALPSDTGLALVLVQHLDPEHESMLARLLANATVMPVAEVEEGMAVEPNHVYVIPPNKIMGISNGTLHLTARLEPTAKHLPIDYFLHSLAEDQGNRAIGVILSGTASDGALGLKAIKTEGGVTFAQDIKSAKYDGMPRSAIATGCVDLVLPPEAIAGELARIGRHPYLGMTPPVQSAEPATESDDELHKIFVVLQKATGVNFTYYKYATIKRRIARRMLLNKLESLQQYLQFLHQNPAEPAALYEDILIHVTGFFREPEAYQALADRVFPEILDKRPPGESVRVWVPGCSTGEEVYSIAMALVECLGERVRSIPIQIFGTDISEGSIAKARVGMYSENSLGGVSPERLRRFFVKMEGSFQITKSLREMCIFARQDLAQDPPFSRLDLISCRNVLIYMGPVLQKKVMAMFHYALKPAGFLIQGKSESLHGFVDLFTVIDREHKIYSKRPVDPNRIFDLSSAAGYERAMGTASVKREMQAPFDVRREADRIVLSQYAPAGLVVNEGLQILHFRGQSSPYLSPPPGEASLSLLRMARPELAADLRTALHRAKQQEIAVRKEGIRVERDGQLWDVSLEVVPIKGDLGERFFLVLFQETPVREPVGPSPRRQARDRGRRQSLEARLRGELQTTKENLQSIIQEQEAINEELKSANEEALSSNEELQSTNEELETAKEELQATNEELVTVNEQLQSRNSELAELGDDLTNLLNSVNIPILMLSSDWRIRRFTPQAEKLLNLLPGDIGRPIRDIRPNIEVRDLAGLVTEVIDTVSVREREVQDLEGRWYSMRIRPYRTIDKKTDGAVLMFIDIDAARRIHLELQREQNFTAAVLESAAALVMVTDLEGRIVRFNLACRRLSGYAFEEVEGKPVWDVLVPPEETEAVKLVYKELSASRSVREHENHWVDRGGGRHLISWSSAAVAEAQGATAYLVRIGVDVTEARQAEEALQQSKILRQSQAELRALTAGLVEGQEEERRRISQELHDDISQRLAALAMQLEALHRTQGISLDQLQRKLAGLQKQTEALSEDLRRTAHNLHPFTLTHLGLGPALQSYCEDYSKLGQFQMRFKARAMPGTIPSGVALCVYRVVQEALGNVAKHAGAKLAVVSISGSDGVLRVAIRDDGHGFSLDQAKGRGLGLISMEERVRHLGGTFSISSKPGDGTCVEIRIPLETNPASLAVESSTP
ncbi:MAG TPA: chemotaxis protein CheB [Bryobacteraceae bacterium]|nr:chemotaxis protein CheB [Bryobacteraceae bacterium]